MGGRKVSGVLSDEVQLDPADPQALRVYEAQTAVVIRHPEDDLAKRGSVRTERRIAAGYREKSLISQQLWRRERDSNPRGLGGPHGFQVRRLTCCLVSLGVVLITNHDSAVVAPCRPVPRRVARVGV